MILKPSDLNWKFLRYSNPKEKLILSDLDRLEKTQFSHTAMSGTITVTQWIAIFVFCSNMAYDEYFIEFRVPYRIRVKKKKKRRSSPISFLV